MSLQGNNQKPASQTNGKKPALVAPTRAVAHVPPKETEISKASDAVKMPGEGDPDKEIGSGKGHSNDPTTDKTPIRVERKVTNGPSGKVSTDSGKKPQKVKITRPIAQSKNVLNAPGQNPPITVEGNTGAPKNQKPA